MTISSLFKKLGAPLINARWSWGAERESDGAIFLRVWQDRKIVKDRVPIMRITHHSKYVNDPENRGWKERLMHIEKVRNGAKCYLIMCRVEDPNATPRKIKSFNEKEIFVGGELREMEGDLWVPVIERIPVSEAKSS